MSEKDGEEGPSVIMLIMLCSQFFLLLLFLVFGIFALLLFSREYPKQQEQLVGLSVTIKKNFVKKRQQKEATKKSAELSPKSKAFLEYEKKNHSEVEVEMADEPENRGKGLFDQTERSEMSTEASEMVKKRNSIIQMNEQFSGIKDVSLMGRTAKETGKSVMGKAEKTCKEMGKSIIGKAEKTCKETGKSMLSKTLMGKPVTTATGLKKSLMGLTAKEVGKSARSKPKTAKNVGEPGEKTCKEKGKSTMGRTPVSQFKTNASGLNKSLMGLTAKEVGKSARSKPKTVRNVGEPGEKTCREKDKSKMGVL